METDVLVVGAGIVGVCAALELIRRGRAVLVVERKEVGAGASGNNAGSMAAQSKLLSMAGVVREAVDMWQELQDELRQEGLDLGYVRSGGLRLAQSREEIEELQRAGAIQRAAGMPVTFLTGEEARSIAPYLGEEVMAANWCPEDGFCDVLHAMHSLAVVLRNRGATIWTQTEVTSIERDGSGFKVGTTNGPIRAGSVVLAAGVWARELLGLVGVSFPLSVGISVLSVTRRAAPFIGHMITHASHRLTVKQLKVGTVIVGGGWPGEGDYRSDSLLPVCESLRGNWTSAVRAIPALEFLTILRTWAGAQGRSPDNLPLIGEFPSSPGLSIGMCCSPGMLVGPFIGRALAELISTGHTPKGLRRFSPDRFSAVGRG
jgi:glycine/D-amino acid oxidase-like deaminating enzyme